VKLWAQQSTYSVQELGTRKLARRLDQGVLQSTFKILTDQRVVHLARNLDPASVRGHLSIRRVHFKVRSPIKKIPRRVIVDTRLMVKEINYETWYAQCCGAYTEPSGNNYEVTYSSVPRNEARWFVSNPRTEMLTRLGTYNSRLRF